MVHRVMILGGGNMINSEDLNILLGPNYVPEGNYNVRLCEMDLSPSKDNDHYYILVYFEILDGVFRGRMIKQVWSFRKGQEKRTTDRINNFLYKKTCDKINATNDTICSIFDKIRSKLINEKFVARLIKNIETRSELLFAEKILF